MAERLSKDLVEAASESPEAAFSHGSAGREDNRSDARPLAHLLKRVDFLAAARARRQPVQSMLVQARFRDDGDPVIRVGFTCSKKVGNAVARNRAKRRLREIARLGLPELGCPGWDYVLIGRKDATAERPFEALRGDLAYALRKLHGKSA